MRYTKYFTTTLRDAPKDADTRGHALMTRAGFLKQSTSGIYSYLPLGLRSIRKIEGIIRKYMDEAGSVEVLLPMVQSSDVWIRSGRWEVYGKEMLRFQDRSGRDYCLAPTHEDLLADMLRTLVNSYSQLPFNLYQIQTKFRDEVRPRFGLIRGREFIMKDAYSFDMDEEASLASYEVMRQAYIKLFHHMGLDVREIEADSGEIGGSLSQEFVVLSDIGEDIAVSCVDCGYTSNAEVASEAFNLDAETLDVEALSEALKGTNCTRCKTGINDVWRVLELGHIFNIGTKYSVAANLTYKGQDGKDRPVHMGSYGIGVGRILAVAAQIYSDDAGLQLPINIAPFEVCIVSATTRDDEVVSTADKLYQQCLDAGIDAIYDDRDVRAGVKFADGELVGYPFVVVVGKRGLASGTVEVKARNGTKNGTDTATDTIAVPISDFPAEMKKILDRARPSVN